MHRSRRKNQLIPLQISSSLMPKQREHINLFAYTSRVVAADKAQPKPPHGQQTQLFVY
jgi:hypothetical protein